MGQQQAASYRLVLQHGCFSRLEGRGPEHLNQRFTHPSLGLISKPGCVQHCSLSSLRAPGGESDSLERS